MSIQPAIIKQQLIQLEATTPGMVEVMRDGELVGAGYWNGKTYQEGKVYVDNKPYTGVTLLTESSRLVLTGVSKFEKIRYKGEAGSWNGKTYGNYIYLNDRKLELEEGAKVEYVFEDAPTKSPSVKGRKISEEQAYDNLHNEGGDGYNPYRSEAPWQNDCLLMEG